MGSVVTEGTVLRRPGPSRPLTKPSFPSHSECLLCNAFGERANDRKAILTPHSNMPLVSIISNTNTVNVRPWLCFVANGSRERKQPTRQKDNPRSPPLSIVVHNVYAISQYLLQRGRLGPGPAPRHVPEASAIRQDLWHLRHNYLYHGVQW